jgi:restriction system protein
VREAERAQRDYDRAVAAAERAATKAQAQAQAEAKEAHRRRMRASAESATCAALDAFEQIDSILAATLDVDDYVDIKSLKAVPNHPPFPREDLKRPLPEPKLERSSTPEPQFVPPPPPSGLSKMFGKQKHAELTARAHAAWVEEHRRWYEYVHKTLPAKNAERFDAYAALEEQRAQELAVAIAEYREICEERERNVAQLNAQIDAFAKALADGDPEAIAEYVGIVLSNSAYPEAFQVDHDYEFDSETGELTVTAHIPPPSAVPNVKSYKYIVAADEIRETRCSQKEQRERYNSAVAAVAIRTFHEVFESDREGRIKTISLTVQTEDNNPATGLQDAFPLVAAAADREEFTQYDLRNVDPAQTLTLMRASLSKNAFDLKPISMARGIR